MEKSFNETSERSVLSDLSQMSISCGEERPTYRSRITSKTPRKNGLKERDKSGKTPNKSQTAKGADRYIPNFALLDKEKAHFKLLQEEKARKEENESNANNNPEDTDTQTKNEQIVDPDSRFDVLTEGSVCNSKILSLANQSRILGVAPKVGFACSSQKSSKVKSTRHIPSEPIKALDAPDLSIDFYLNLVDWSAQNFLAVALESGVYMWNAETGEIVDFVDFGDEKTVTSIKFKDEGCHIAIGLSDGSLLIYDTETKEKLRSLKGHSQRVCSLAWNEYLLCSGARSGMILAHDARARTSRPDKIISAHDQEVCSLTWNSEKTLLASGSSDTTVKIWNLGELTDNTCMTTLSGHVAAVKAVCWSPFDNSTIATGGGIADKSIKLWNVNTGRDAKTIDTGAQVSAIAFSTCYSEMISAHGYSSNALTIWKYPSLTKIKDLTAHTGRILHMCLSPNGEIVASASDDESIRLWQVFAKDEAGSKKASAGKNLLGGNSKGNSQSNLLSVMQHR